MMKYSFVLPAYKATFLKESIQSILNQTLGSFELIIVNDASPENISSIVSLYSDDRIHYYENIKNIGGRDLVAQWNLCLSYAIGEYIILASDDDVYYPRYLETIDRLITKYPSCYVFRPRVSFIDYDGNIIQEEGFIDEFQTYSQFLTNFFSCRICSGIPFYCFQRKALMDINGFRNYPLAWHSDDATVIELAQKGIVTSSDVMFGFRLSGLSITTQMNNEELLLKKLKASRLFYEDMCIKLSGSEGAFIGNDLYGYYWGKTEYTITNTSFICLLSNFFRVLRITKLPFSFILRKMLFLLKQEIKRFVKK